MRKSSLAEMLGSRLVTQISGLVLVNRTRVQLLARILKFLCVTALRTFVPTRTISIIVAHLGMLAISTLIATSATTQLRVMLPTSKVLAFSQHNRTRGLGPRAVNAVSIAVRFAAVGVVMVEVLLADVVIAAILVTAAISARVAHLQISVTVVTVVRVAIHHLRLLFPAIKLKQLLSNVRWFSTLGMERSFRLIKLVSRRISPMLRSYQFICYLSGRLSC
jgi:hypothetical protein